jgi:hypothetical protein
MPYESSSAASDVSLERFGLRMIRGAAAVRRASETAEGVAKCSSASQHARAFFVADSISGSAASRSSERASGGDVTIGWF